MKDVGDEQLRGPFTDRRERVVRFPLARPPAARPQGAIWAGGAAPSGFSSVLPFVGEARLAGPGPPPPPPSPDEPPGVPGVVTDEDTE